MRSLVVVPAVRAGSAALVAVLLTVLVFVCAVAPARAGTTIAGDKDTTPPLVIEPGADSEPLTFERRMSGPEGRVMFIQNMPVTKRIRSVTLGDLAAGSNCTMPARVMLSVREHATPDLEAYPTVTVGSSSWVTLPPELGKVTFTLSSPALLKKGNAYSFHVGWGYSGSDCQFAKIRSWRHDLGAVNSGPMTCTAGPAMIRQDGSSGVVRRRMLHAYGAGDSHPSCVSSSGGFDPTMPGGWLVTSTTSYSYVETDQRPTEPPEGWTDQTCGNSSVFGNAGIGEVGWRELRSQWYDEDGVLHDEVYATEQACVWTSFRAPDLPSPDGWYYSIPWIQSDAGQGRPRTMYLRLDTIDYDGLLSKYAPVLKFDTEAEYWNASAQTMTDWPENTLSFSLGPASTGPCATFSSFDHEEGGNPDWGLETLVAPPAMYPGTACYPSVADNVDANGDDKAAADSYRYGPLDNIAYGRAVHGSQGELWLQYWLFYYNNTKSLATQGNHQGDWEMVQYRVGSDGVATRATYAQHYDDEADGCTYDKVEKYPLVVGGVVTRQAPVVYVASGSQASYFGEGTNPRGGLLPADTADGEGELRNVEPNLVKSPPAWFMWPGRWGGDDTGEFISSSPQGPAHQGDKWDDPTAFDAQAGPCVNPDDWPPVSGPPSVWLVQAVASPAFPRKRRAPVFGWSRRCEGGSSHALPTLVLS